MDTRMQDQAQTSSDAHNGSDPAAGSAVDALQQELTKWQARVPKLAGALKEKTREVDALQAELDQVRRGATSGATDASSGIQARDALIEELEAKVKALSAKHQDAEGQLHARDLEISSLRQEAAEWRDKWQAATANLDQQSDASEQKDRALKRHQKEVDELLAAQEQHSARVKEQDLELTALREKCTSLESRNEKLFETTELANRQIETLGDNLEHLRDELKRKNEILNARDAEAGGSIKEIDELKKQLGSRDEDIEFLHAHIEEKQKEIAELTSRVSELQGLEAAGAEVGRERERLNRLLEEKDTELGALSDKVSELATLAENVRGLEAQVNERDRELAEKLEAIETAEQARRELDGALDGQRAEVLRLEECVAKAEEANSRWEAERRELSVQMDELKKRNQHLEAQLTERSDLVVGLEQEKSAISDRTTSLEEENARLSEALEKAQRHSAENADHIAQVDARLERQKQLMENLEQEFAEVQEEYADAVKKHQRELAEKSEALATLKDRLEEDSSGHLEERIAGLEAELDEARSARETAERGDREHQDRIDELTRELDQKRTQDDSARLTLTEKVEKLEKQLRKQSTATAEAEEAAAQAKASLEALKAERSAVPDDAASENLALQAEVVKLEGMVRERTEQLNKLRWQQDMFEKQAVDGTESKMLVVLNQQLAVAREDNARLLERVRDLESSAGELDARDDLSKIRGIGPKLVRQLNRLGISRFDQIATLSEADLDDEKHPLHAMKGRILKDGWIEQAARQGSG
jgi:chromosome segregation ATPase